jgi:hypothetical protein
MSHRPPSRRTSDPLRASFRHSDDEVSDDDALALSDEDEVDSIFAIPEDDDDDDGRKDGDDDDEPGKSGGVQSFGFHRRSSMSTIEVYNSCRSLSPHDLAASVSSAVKLRFKRNLPAALLQDYDNRDCIAPFRTDEIILGPLLGSGEFSHVYEVKAFRPKDTLEITMSKGEDETRKNMKRREKYRDTKKSSYALKHLRPQLLDKYETQEYAQFASDLVQEAEFLNSLIHPNIIKLRGISLSGAEGFSQGPKGYFLIIDRLNETLDKRIRKWKKWEKRGNRLASSITMLKSAKRSGSKNMDDEEGGLIASQLYVALQIAAAMVYLHEKNIIFRDLKPESE